MTYQSEPFHFPFLLFKYTTTKMEEQINPCKRISYLKFVDTETGELHNVKCKCYACEHCGRIKIIKLTNAIEDWLKSHDKIRMWTFTLTTKFANTSVEHRKQLQKVWHHFMRNLRRCNALSTKQKSLQYVRVAEFHSKYEKNSLIEKRVRGMHYHCFFTEYLHWQTVSQLWELACESVIDSKVKLGHVNVRSHSLSAKQASRYVAKYVMKSVTDSLQKIKRWSKSGKVALFAKVEIVAKGKFKIVDLREENDLNLYSLSTTAQEIRPPPELLTEFNLEMEWNLYDELQDGNKLNFLTNSN